MEEYYFLESCRLSDIKDLDQKWILVMFLFEIFPIHKRRHQRSSVKKCVLKNFAKLTGKNMCWSLLFNKVAGLSPETLIRKRLQHRCFPVKFVIFLRYLF